MLALSRITLKVNVQEQLDDGLLPYLAKHGQYVDSINLCNIDLHPLSLCQLPSSLQLASLQFDSMLRR